MENSKELFVKAFLEAEKLDNTQLKKRRRYRVEFFKKI